MAIAMIKRVMLTVIILTMIIRVILEKRIRTTSAFLKIPKHSSTKKIDRKNL